MPILISLQTIKEDVEADNLTSVIIKALKPNGGVASIAISSRLLCFEEDGIKAFQGIYTRMTKQLKDKWSAFMSAMHDMAHMHDMALWNMPNSKKILLTRFFQN